MRKTILYIAMTLDGYIADDKDDFSFLAPYNGLESVSKSYESLLSRIDTLIMGKRTFDVINRIVDWPYQSIESYIMTRKIEKDQDHIFYRSDIKELITELKNKNGKDIWIVGGGLLISSMLEMNLIDEFQIAIVPKLIGSGKPLFPSMNYLEDLELIEMKNLDGLVFLTYKKNNSIGC
ncbi:MAG: dihydrofolate reductase family protein [Acholeplasmataceae bacterium]|nr:dihydrofolate reductase family protein [Acholeplasmataceae bacterium]